MSLLLEALKKAEKAKRANASDAPAQGAPEIESGSSHDFALETPSTESANPQLNSYEAPDKSDEPATLAAPGIEQAFPEILLVDREAPEPSPAPLETIQAAPIDVPEKKPEPALSLDFPEPTPPASEPPPRQPDATPAIAKAVPAPKPATPQTPSPALHNGAAQKQEAAKKILAAKQGKPKRNLKLLGGILAGSMVIGAALAYYYWQALSQPTIAFLPPQQAPTPPAAQPPALQQPVAQPAEADEDADETPPQPEPASANKPTAQKKPVEKPEASSKQGETPPEKKTSPTPNEPASGIKFRRDAGDAKLDPLLTSAYQAFTAGDMGRAENDYRKALQQTPNSRDALLGLAAMATNRGQPQEAATHYLHILQLDPKDATAQAGLIGLKGYSDPTLSESRLKTLLAQQPDTGYLHFALGNLYAHQSRWPEAQEAYFNALHGDAGNADYAFNLAVSLEHLDQRKPALVYYQRALTLVKERSVSFDSEQLKKRIYELQPN